ncbi:DUF1772 domain-containing protein [Nonomuraea sp. PA05]|uniref:anthrone oxygenase family protein n=1 Tax=Nonomuraea sp. PA05 TaxID=2604466 RepID=UPI0011DA7CCA|nr:DUF1772 domain-containing protein [Nonomuraea sp. PA05]TYB60577.1 DUF1772 domain-containing protein [Nonomuraea sp. PA05]
MRELMGTMAVLGSGLTAGVLFCVALSVVPALRALPPDRYVQAHQLLGRNYDPTMPVIVLSTALVDVLLAVVTPEAGTRSLFVIAGVLMVGVSAVSHLCNVPINRRVKGLDPAAMPQDWTDPRPVWRRWHLLRTVLSVVALVVNAAAVALA